MEDSHSAAAPRTASRPWLLFLAGVLLFIAGPALYIVQVSQARLWMPWYVLVLAALGLVLMALSVWRRPGAVRIACLLLFVAIFGLETFVLAVATKTPLYSGPARPGQKLPIFTAAVANRAPFTSLDLEKGIPTALVFFRGRW
jgi:hypothetical protein